MSNRNALIGASALAIRLAMVANGCFIAAIGAGLVASLALGGHFTTLLLGPDLAGDIAGTTTGMRCLMLTGLAAAALIQYIALVLGRILAAVAADDPFAVTNAGRIRRIAWALLAFQMLDVPMMAIRHAFPGLGNAAPDTGLSPGGWLAVLMMFVLARIFTTGTSMRDYLRETI